MESVDHLEGLAEIFLGELVEHASVHQAFHEGPAVLRQSQRAQPLIPHPFVTHLAYRC